MKKFLFYVGVALAIAFSLTGCKKEVQNPDDTNIVIKKGIPFEIVATPAETRTENDGMNTKWVADDAINVFHSVADGTSYVEDGEFTITNPESNSFNGEVAEPLEEGKTYDWYMVYPYNSYLHSIANTGTNPARYYIGKRSDLSQEQNGNDSKAHLAGTNFPLFGVQKGVAYNAKPSLSVNHVASYIEVKVTNSNDDPLTVESVKFTAPDGEKIVGQYEVDFSQNPISFTMYKTYASEEANLTVTGGTAIAKGANASFFLGIKPFTAGIGNTLKVSVNGYEKEISLSKETSFSAGKIKKINFNYDKPDERVELNWIYPGGTSSDLNSVPGVTTYGLGTDYAEQNAPYRVKFDTDGDYIQVKTDKVIGHVVIGVKMFSADENGEGAIKVQGSANGNTFTDVQTLSISGKQNAIVTLESTEAFDESYRYVRFVFVKKVNVGVGPISIFTVSSSDEPVIVVEDVDNVAIAGGSFSTTYTLSHWDGDDDVTATCDGTIVTQATASNGTVSFTVAPNYTKSTKEGKITLTSTSNGATADIKVHQLASSGLTVSETTVTIPSNATSATFTLTTKDYGWDAIVTPASSMNLSVNPTHGNASEEAQTVTVTSTTAETSSEQTLGTIEVYRNGNTSDTQKKTITVKKAAIPASGTTVTWTASSGSLGSAISAVNGTATGTIKTSSTSPELSYDWSYTRTLTKLVSGKTDYCALNQYGYMQLGSSNAVESVEFKSSTIPGTITSVSVDCASYNNAHNIAITVGGNTYFAKSATPKWENNTGDIVTGTGSSSGNIVISFTDGSRALYIKSITVVFEN